MLGIKAYISNSRARQRSLSPTDHIFLAHSKNYWMAMSSIRDLHLGAREPRLTSVVLRPIIALLFPVSSLFSAGSPIGPVMPVHYEFHKA